GASPAGGLAGGGGRGSGTLSAAAVGGSVSRREMVVVELDDGGGGGAALATDAASSSAVSARGAGALRPAARACAREEMAPTSVLTGAPLSSWAMISGSAATALR